MVMEDKEKMKRLVITAKRPDGSIEVVDVTEKLARTRMIPNAYIRAAADAMGIANRGEIVDWSLYYADGSIEDTKQMAAEYAAQGLAAAARAQAITNKIAAGRAMVYRGMDATGDSIDVDHSPSHKQEED